MINEIHPHLFNNQFNIPKAISEDDYVLCFNEDSMLLKQNGENLDMPRKKDFKGITSETKKTFLFTLNNNSCFLVWDLPLADSNQFVYKEIKFFRSYNKKEFAWISIVGYQMMNWYAQNKFCGKCGSKTVEKTDERAITCPSCNTTVYPKISPAIIVAIVSGNKILLAHNSNFPSSWHSLVAGYVDIGESLEETVAREVKEEVGLDVNNIRYYKSQPWPYSGSMMIGFVAEADPTQTIIVDNKEITDAAWFERGNLPDHPANISIAGEMIDKFEHNEL